MCKRVGAVDQMNAGELFVKCLAGLSDKESAEAVGQHFAAISAEHSPVDPDQLPAFLPALPPPQVTEWEVHAKLAKLKNTRTTLDIDIENKLRKEVSVELVTPLTDIINKALTQQRWPAIWKIEQVSPTPKCLQPEQLKDLRKISCTSDYNKLFEGFMKGWILEDIGDKIDVSQYGGKKGVGCEHMIVAMVDRVLALLDQNPDKSAVILSGIDWANTFARGDPTKTICKFLNLGLCPSLALLLADYFSNRQMSVHFNTEKSQLIKLIGGFPEGSLIGQDAYIVASNDSADVTSPEDRFKYIDDLEVSELILLAGILEDYDFWSHVLSDIGIDQQFLPPHQTKSQQYLNYINNWTENNLMKINSSKSNYQIFSRCQTDFATRLTIGGDKIDRKPISKILGVWISEDAGDWSINTSEICKKSYARISMLSKLKYSGVSIEDLVQIYCLFIRSRAEHCSVAFHSSLTSEQTSKLNNIEKTCLKIILKDMYIGHLEACEMVGISPLAERRQARMLAFAKKCIKHPENSRFFPLNNTLQVDPQTREREKFQVNFARTESYKKSTIPTCQRLLNTHFSQLPNREGDKWAGQQGGEGGQGEGARRRGQEEGPGGRRAGAY